MDDEERHLEDACYARVMAMGYTGDNYTGNQWIKFLMDLVDVDSGTVDAEDAQEVEGLGWIEDTHGGAVFVPYS